MSNDSENQRRILMRAISNVQNNPFQTYEGWQETDKFVVRREVIDKTTERPTARSKKQIHQILRDLKFDAAHAWHLSWGGKEVDRKSLFFAHESINKSRQARITNAVLRLVERVRKIHSTAIKIFVTADVDRYKKLNLFKNATYRIEVVSTIGKGQRKILGEISISQNLSSAQIDLLVAGKKIKIEEKKILGIGGDPLILKRELNEFVEGLRTTGDIRSSSKNKPKIPVKSEVQSSRASDDDKPKDTRIKQERTTKNRGTKNRLTESDASSSIDRSQEKPDNVKSKTDTPNLPKARAKFKHSFKLLQFKNIRFSPKLRASLKIGAGFIFEIGLSLLESWIDNRILQEEFKEIVPNINLEADRAFQSAEYEVLKFRTGNELEKGYQLYFKISFKVSRYVAISCDQVCVSSSSIKDIQLARVEIVRNRSKNKIPDPKGSNSNGLIFQPIFEYGKDITRAVHHAADGNLTGINSLLSKGREKYLNSQRSTYLRNFYEYIQLFPASASANAWQQRLKHVEFKKLLTGVGLYEAWDLLKKENVPFEKIIEDVRWEESLVFRDAFIKEFKDRFLKSQFMKESEKRYFLKKYNKYFALLRNSEESGYCNVSHHSTNDRSLKNRGVIEPRDIIKDRPKSKSADSRMHKLKF